MIYILLKNNDFKYSVEHLIKEFYPNKVLNFIEDVKHEETCIEIIIEINNTTCRIYSDNRLQVEYSKEFKSNKSLDEQEIKKQKQRLVKYALYKALSKYTQNYMSWGTLVGIRPTKIVHEYIKQGVQEEKIESLLQEEYCVSHEKINLMLDVAAEEQKILQKNKNDEISIYIGIPFCPTRCLYCSFTSYSIEKYNHLVDLYIEALIKEIDWLREYTKNRSIRSIYIGGGTPTSLSSEQLTRLLDYIDKIFDTSKIEEFTVEAGRPDTITEEKLKVLKQYNVSRISINPQTMNQKTLDLIGRKHTVEDIKNTFSLARKAGHNNINMDIILGLPDETFKDFQNTLSELKLLKPENITVHTMAIKRAAILKQSMHEYKMTTKEVIQQMLSTVEKTMHEMNMKPYYLYRQKNMLGNFENVGYSISEKECIYNIEIMEEKQTIIALGAGAISKIVDLEKNKIDRIENVKSVEDYINRIDEMIDRKKKGV